VRSLTLVDLLKGR